MSPATLPAHHTARMLPPLETVCADCKSYAWARLPQFEGHILCAVCYPPSTWETLELAQLTPPAPASLPPLGRLIFRQRAKPLSSCPKGHHAWKQVKPAFPDSWICGICCPGRGPHKDLYIQSGPPLKIPLPLSA